MICSQSLTHFPLELPGTVLSGEATNQFFFAEDGVQDYDY